MEVISLWHCWGGIEAQVSLTVAFGSSAFFGLLFLIFLSTILSDSLWGSGLASLLASQANQHYGHLTNFWCFWQCVRSLFASIASVRFDPLAWSSGSDQRRISGCGIRWLLAGPDSLPLWLCRVCAFVLLRCFSCSHTVLPKEHSLGVMFFSSLSSCKCCIFLQFYLHFTTDYTCMIVYVTNNKEPGAKSCWKIKSASLKSWSAEGSTKCSKMSW